MFLLVDTTIVAITWAFYLHPKYVLKHKLYFEMVTIFTSFWLFSHLSFWLHFLSAYVTTIYLLLNFSLSHTHLPVTNEPTHWVEYSLLHTVDVEQTPWCDWWMGYLNYQIEHHLFPTMPQFRHRFIKDRVRALAMKHNLPYHVYSYGEAIQKTFRNLSDVSKDLSKM